MAASSYLKVTTFRIWLLGIFKKAATTYMSMELPNGAMKEIQISFMASDEALVF